MKALIRVLRPFANCIAVAEKADGSLGEAVNALFEYVRSLFNLDWENDMYSKAVEAFLLYFNKEKLGDEEYGIILASYFMDRRFKMDYITVEGCDLVFETVVKVATLTGYSPDSMDEILVNEFTNFTKQRGTLSRIAEPTEKSTEWWEKQEDCGILKRAGVRLGNLRSSSANLERLFSMVKIIQGTNRTRFSLSTLENIARVKLDMAQADYQDDVLSDMNENTDSADISGRESQCSSRSRVSSRGRRALSTSIVSSPGTPHQISQDTFMCQIEKLDKKIQDIYIEFISLVDFSVIKTLQQDNISTVKKAGSEDVQRLVERLRENRRSDS